MRRRISFTAAVLLLLASGCTRNGDDAQRYVIDVDARSDAKEKFQFSAYFPAEVQAAPGDTIRFRNRSTEAPHTVTFGILPDRSNQPNILIPTGENPAVREACDTDDEPTNLVVKCPDKRLGAYDGTGYWNSGYLQPLPARRNAGAKNVTLRLADDIKPGDYSYVCILHPFMSGTVEIVQDAGDRSDPVDVRGGAQEGAADTREKAEDFDEPKLKRDGDEVTVAAGWGDKVTAVNRFAPDEIEIEKGTTVTWAVRSPYEPHTVTFDSPFEGPEDRGALEPGGVQDGGEYRGGFASSGIIGKVQFPFESYSLEFTKSGTYEYVCILHPGQTGVVKVE